MHLGRESLQRSGLSLAAAPRNKAWRFLCYEHEH